MQSHKFLVKEYLECISKEMYSLSTKYDTILILEINSEPNEKAMKNFCQIHNLNE